MPKIRFGLKRSDPENRSAIILYYKCSDGELKYYTGQKGTSSGFDRGTEAVLIRMKQVVDVFEIECKIADKPFTKTAVIEKLDTLFRNKAEAHTLFVHMDLVLEKMANGSILTEGNKRYSESTIKALNHARNMIEKFSPLLKRSSVTMDTYKKFIVYCQGENFSINYIGALIKNWKILGKQVGDNPIYDNDAFKKISEVTPHIYLDETELAVIYEKVLTDRYDVVRDWFILSCYTGLRVSDLLRLSKQNYSAGYITIANDKTDETVVIPTHKYVRAIIKKHNGFPPMVTDVEINRLIKEIAKSCGLTESVLFTITKGGRRVDKYIQKWKMVSCHTGRRSLVTNLRKNGVPDSITMKLTGIKATSTLRKYDKLNATEAARIAAGHEFFK